MVCGGTDPQTDLIISNRFHEPCSADALRALQSRSCGGRVCKESHIDDAHVRVFWWRKQESTMPKPVDDAIVSQVGNDNTKPSLDLSILFENKSYK